MIRLFLCGDVMTGRGIDQIFPYSCPPRLHEPYVKDARDYVKIAENKHGPIPRQVSPEYVWGDALAEFDRFTPEFKIINLETSITLSDQWVDKGINYRMHPKNIEFLSKARIDCCVLANNHILDWGVAGMSETLDALRHAGIQAPGAGHDFLSASAPAALSAESKGRVLVFSFGFESSGIPHDWAARPGHPGVWLVNGLSEPSLREIGERVRQERKEGDIVITSIHWGPNWGHQISWEETAFAHALIDEAGVDLIHGHSSHHPKAFEVYRGKLILYGCGDFINDYEGISGYEEFRGDLGLMYFADIDSEKGRLSRLEMVPTQMKGFQVKKAPARDVDWLAGVLSREGERFGIRVQKTGDRLAAVWDLQ